MEEYKTPEHIAEIVDGTDTTAANAKTNETIELRNRIVELESEKISLEARIRTLEHDKENYNRWWTEEAEKNKALLAAYDALYTLHKIESA